MTNNKTNNNEIVIDKGDVKTILFNANNILGFAVKKDKKGNKVIYLIKPFKGLVETNIKNVEINANITELPDVSGEWIETNDKKGNRWIVRKSAIHSVRNNGRSVCVEVRIKRRKFLHIIKELEQIEESQVLNGDKKEENK